MANIKCTFTSIWSDGSVITTNADYNPEDGSVFVELSDADPDGNLENEYITLPDGTELNVCPVCHDYVMKTIMVPDNTGKGMHEAQECEDPDCDNKQ